MKEPQVPLNAKHILFSISIIACLIIGSLSFLFALIAANDSNYFSAGMCMIPSVLSFGCIMFSNLSLLKNTDL